MSLYSQDWITKPIPVGGVVNANFDDPSSEQHHALNDVIHGSDGTQWRYVKAHAAIAAAGTVAIAASGVTQSGSTHSARVAFAKDEYGWVKKV